MAMLSTGVRSQSADPQLPAVVQDPLAISGTDDPILALARIAATDEQFREAVAGALARTPSLMESKAQGRAALAAEKGARSGLYPTIDLQFTANRSITRNYSNDPDNVLERARGPGRADSSASMQQILWDFGATKRRIEGAAARIDSAQAQLDYQTESAALRIIGAWYDVFGYAHLVRLSEENLANVEALRLVVRERISSGVSAEVDIARADSAVASANLRLAQFQRELGNAKARFVELFGNEPPARIARAPAHPLPALSDDALANKAARSSAVRAAEANARGARSDARAARADTLPNVSAGVDAGKYGMFEYGRNDYDIRGRVTVRQRLLGPGPARAAEAYARADASEARAMSVRMEATREARIAWSDVTALESSISAYRENYLASRITRDAVSERFRVSRGTLFDVLQAEDAFFMSAANFIRALSEVDAARYVALARSGDLLDTLGVEPATRGSFR